MTLPERKVAPILMMHCEQKYLVAHLTMKSCDGMLATCLACGGGNCFGWRIRDE